MARIEQFRSLNAETTWDDVRLSKKRSFTLRRWQVLVLFIFILSVGVLCIYLRENFVKESPVLIPEVEVPLVVPKERIPDPVESSVKNFCDQISKWNGQIANISLTTQFYCSAYKNKIKE